MQRSMSPPQQTAQVNVRAIRTISIRTTVYLGNWPWMPLTDVTPLVTCACLDRLDSKEPLKQRLEVYSIG